MEKKSKKKVTWEIKNLLSLGGCEVFKSDEFIVGGCKWRLCAFSYLECNGFLSYYLEVADYRSLPSGWRRHARYLIYLVNRNSAAQSEQNEGQKWFDQNFPISFAESMYTLNEICDKDSGFMVNGVLKIVAEIEVLQVSGKLDVTETTSTIREDVNGFQVLSPQVELATHMFERHPDIASELRPKNPKLRTVCMSLLLSLVEALPVAELRVLRGWHLPPMKFPNSLQYLKALVMCLYSELFSTSVFHINMLFAPYEINSCIRHWALRHSSHELQKDDLAESHALLVYMTDAGFKVDWLQKKLDEISEKKGKEEFGESRMQEIEDELKDLKKTCSDLEAELKKEKAEFLDAKAPISFDDVI